MRKELQQGRASTTYSQTSLEDQIEEAATLKTANDLAWKSRDTIELTKWLGKVLKERYWEDVPVNRFFEELERSFLAFTFTFTTLQWAIRPSVLWCGEQLQLALKRIISVNSLSLFEICRWKRSKHPQHQASASGRRVEEGESNHNQAGYLGRVCQSWRL